MSWAVLFAQHLLRDGRELELLEQRARECREPLEHGDVEVGERWPLGAARKKKLADIEGERSGCAPQRT